MKIAATIIGMYQCGPNDYQTTKTTYVFDDSVTIAEILRRTGQKSIVECNLTDVAETLAAKEE